MKTLTKLVVAMLVVQVVWFLLPQVEWRWLSEDANVILSYAGFESYLGMEPWLSWTFLAMTVVITIGLLFFGPKWRILFISYIALTTLILVPLSGMNIETGLSMTLRDILSMLYGALIAVLLLRTDSSRADNSRPTSK